MQLEKSHILAVQQAVQAKVALEEIEQLEREAWIWNPHPEYNKAVQASGGNTTSRRTTSGQIDHGEWD